MVLSFRGSRLCVEDGESGTIVKSQDAEGEALSVKPAPFGGTAQVGIHGDSHRACPEWTSWAEDSCKVGQDSKSLCL